MAKFRRKTKKERREEIRNAARNVFLRKGYRDTTMEDIIAETTLSKGGVYLYYSSPKQILMDIMDCSNTYRLLQLKKLNENLSDELSLKEVLKALTLNKLFDENIDKRIYIMFLAEMIYDNDIAEMYYKFERESKQKTFSIIAHRLPNLKAEELEANFLLISRIINVLIMGDQLFRDVQIFKENQNTISEMLDVLYEAYK